MRRKLAAVLEELSLASGETPADKSSAKLMSALAKRDEESRRNPVRLSHFERFITGGDYPDQEKAALHLFKYLSSKDLVHAMTASLRFVRFATQLPFTMSLRVAEVVRLGKTATAGGKLQGESGLLRGCHLLIGAATDIDQGGGDVVGAEGVEPLSTFFTHTSRIVDSLAVQFGSTVNDPSIQAFLELLSRPILSRLLALSLERCTMGILGLKVLGETMRQKCLPVLSMFPEPTLNTKGFTNSAL